MSIQACDQWWPGSAGSGGPLGPLAVTAAAKKGAVFEPGKVAYVCLLVIFCHALLHPCSQAALALLSVLHCNAATTALE